MRRESLATALVVAACACGDTRAPAARPAAGSSSPPPSASSSAVGALDAASADVPSEMPKLVPVLDDPRLAVARERERARDPSGAAREMDRVMSAGAGLDAAQECAWSFLAGRLRLAAGEAADAAVAFDRVASPPDGAPPCPLAAYASLRGAQTLVRLGRFDDAIARARAVGNEIAAQDEAKLVLADALKAKGERPSAIPLWRSLLGASPHGERWADTAVQLATALLDGADGPAPSRAREALDLATRVLVEAPITADKVDVLGLRTRAASALRSRRAPPLTPEERVRQAQAWLDASQPKRARDVAQALVDVLPKGSKEFRDVACKAAIVSAQATPRAPAEDGANAWGAAIARCEEDESLVTALYYGGKASISAHRNDEGLARLARVEKLFPKHRFADDARLRAASVFYDGGDEARYLALLSSLPDAYPEGDMRGEALFRVALAKLSKNDLDGARAVLDRALAIEPDEHAWNSGRAAYFRARIAEASADVDGARQRYAAIIRDQPLAYYMLLAYARLRAIDDAMAQSTLKASVEREEPGSPFTTEHAELGSAEFARFLRLLEVGEIEAARREAHVGGFLADSVDPDVLWTIAWAFDRAGAPDVGHWLARTRLNQFHAHWPAGRWKLPWEVAYPRSWEDLVVRESASSDIPPPLTWAVMREESAFNPDARSVANAIGLMQLLVGSARLVAGSHPAPDESTLRHPDVSIALGARLLASYRKSFSTNPALAIAAYNGGPGAVRRWLTEHGGEDFDVFVERIPYEETRGYLKRVLASEAAYAFLYAPKTFDELLALPLHPSR